MNVTWQREIERQKSLPASFEAVQAIVEALNATAGVKARVRPPVVGTGVLPLTKPSKQWQWAYLDSSRRTRRQVMIVDIESDGACGTLVEFERRKSERSRMALLIPIKPATLLDPGIVDVLAKLAAAEGRWASLTPPPAGMDLVLFNHSRTSAEAFAIAICDALRPSV